MITLDHIPEGLRDYCTAVLKGQHVPSDTYILNDWIKRNVQTPLRPLEVGDRVRNKDFRTVYQECQIIAVHHEWAWTEDNTDGDMQVFHIDKLERIDQVTVQTPRPLEVGDRVAPGHMHYGFQDFTIVAVHEGYAWVKEDLDHAWPLDELERIEEVAA